MQTILLVDDQEELRLLLQATLEDGKFEVLEAPGGLEALRIARSAKPSLVVMDWMMPGMSGIEVVRNLKADAATNSIPIILLTARNQEEDRLAGFSAGVSEYLTKPFSPLELVSKVEMLLGTGRAA